MAMVDSLGVCSFAHGGYGTPLLVKMLSAITGGEWTMDKFMKTGERIFNLEKMFNLREGFAREDDNTPDRFFEEPLTKGLRRGSVIKRDKFKNMMDSYYLERGWDRQKSVPQNDTLDKLRLLFD